MTTAIKLDGIKGTAKAKTCNAMFGEDKGWAILEKLNDYYRMKGWTK